MRHLLPLALGGLMGVCLLASDAQACHKKRCGGGCAPAVCARPAPVCHRPVKTCGHARKSCCGGGLFHKRGCGTCTPPVVVCNTGYVHGGYPYAAPMASGQTYAAPQSSGQMVSPPVPAKR